MSTHVNNSKTPVDASAQAPALPPVNGGNGTAAQARKGGEVVRPVKIEPVVLEEQLNHLLDVCRRNLRTCDAELIRKAFYLCVDAHKRNIRASGEPYYTHPYEVAIIVATEIRLDDVSVAAALLHDVVEDTDFTLEDIRAEFGPVVAEIVDGATKITDVFNSHEVTQAASYRKLLLSMVNDVRVILIKFADRLHNMRTLEYLSPQKQQRMAKETLDIYAPFAHRFGLGNLKWELEDLAFKYLNPEIYAQLKKELNAKRRQREGYIERCIEPITRRLEDEGFKFEINGRAKHLFSIYNKMRLQSKSLDEVHDLMAIRIILDTEQPNDCFTVYGIVSEIYTPVPERFKNYISVPKKNGYQSIHTTLIGPDGKQIEVQIRTRKMHEVAEKGVAAHFIYKESSLNPLITEDRQLEEWVNWIRDIFERVGTDEAPQEVMESFRLNLFQDEIYVFTPKGDLRILPKGATPIDFAFDIHSKIGFHCIGAKVNGKIVPLDTELKSGDQVVILTSKNQTPSPDWEKIAVTHKARSGIRRWMKEERRRQVKLGREMWEKRARRERLHINDDDLERVAHSLRYDHRGDLFFDIGSGKMTADEAVDLVRERMKAPAPKEDLPTFDGQALYDRFLNEARTTSRGVIVDGTLKGLKYSYAKCCSPIPGDQVIGIVSTGKGVMIHRVTCKNVLNLLSEPRTSSRALDVNWDGSDGFEFMAGIRVTGEDRPGMLNDITHAILTYQSTNIRSVNIASLDSLFEGTVMVMVKHIDHLNRLMERLRKIRNVRQVERFEQSGNE
ncbi:MAG TPA: bifunctional (p)ppGpp synthetase/guanosine-3',5'-bis(diphosphate) 3'-pyrophosphohydrolase [Candidatus Kapabacteria bacterium]|nr:bifunctional (p)ppGpp synthetase/guanosine-3',5'-bis(diphosphate) 3'-pyrophosphohydrolase [Candidatus Kapabacteria bacterium]